MKTLKIKHCPFCGERAYPTKISHAELEAIWLIGSSNKEPWHIVRCFGCGASGEASKTLDEAIKNWNERIDDKRPASQYEEIMDIDGVQYNVISEHIYIEELEDVDYD